MKTILTTILFLIICMHSFAQQFEDVTAAQNILHQYYGVKYGGGASFADWDKDGWDDLSLCQFAQPLQFYHNEGGNFVPVPAFVAVTGETKGLVWIDYDNDGDRDLCITIHDGPVKLFQNDGLFNFTDVSIAAGFADSEYLNFACNWGDPNNDGWPDVYICNYNSSLSENPTATNQFFLNNGNGTFTEMATEAGIDNGPHNTFESLWLDYDNDGDQDLCVTNDRIFCHNSLYRNDGNMQFTDVSEQSEMDYHIYSMCCIAEDYDNDRDLDIYISNSVQGSLLHRNNGNGSFTELAQQAAVATNAHCWAAQWMDADNDGWVDLHVSTNPFQTGNGQDYIFRNNPNGIYDDMTEEWGLQDNIGPSHSTAQGDFNNDGTMDLVEINDQPAFTKLWEVQPNGNSWLKVTPVGVVSNIDGIGTLIECYASGQYYSRYTYCGEGYLNQNSYSEIFGLGQNNMVDTLTLTWLSGTVDTWHNLPVNQSLVLYEGSSLIPQITYTGQPVICPGDTLILNGGDYDAWLWNTGHTGQYLNAAEAGEYYVTITTSLGFSFISNAVVIEEYETPVGLTISTHISCFGYNDGSIEISNSSGTGIASIFWSNDEEDTAIGPLAAGQYSYLFTDNNGCHATGSEAIEEPCQLAANFIITDSIACYGELATVVDEIFCGTPPYSISLPGIDWYAGEYEVEVIDNNGCTLTYSIIITQPDSLIAQIQPEDALCFGGTGSATALPQGGTPPYTFNWSNGDEDDTVENLVAGFYSLEVMDANGCLLTDIFQLSQPQELMVEIETIFTDTTTVITAMATGGTGSYSYLWSTGETQSSITTIAGQYAVVYLTVTDANNCIAELEILLDIPESATGALQLFPNPASTVLNVFASGNGVMHTARILDITGKLVWSNASVQSNFMSIDVSHLSQGIYSIEIIDSRQTMSRRKFLRH